MDNILCQCNSDFCVSDKQMWGGGHIFGMV